MPEGDVVYRTAARLRAALVGRVIVRSDFRVPKFAEVDLCGEKVGSVDSYGKHLFIRTDSVCIHTHLKMEGSWRVFRYGQRWTKPRVSARVVLGVQDCEAVGFSLGTVQVMALGEEGAIIENLGPDVLGDEWDPAEAVARIAADPDQLIGIALLDQRNLAGLGNIYRNEICYLRRIHPATPVSQVPDLLALVNESHRVLHRAVTDPPWRPLVYNRAHRPCQRCSNPIASALLGETAPATDRIVHRERGIYYCPTCQPPP